MRAFYSKARVSLYLHVSVEQNGELWPSEDLDLDADSSPSSPGTPDTFPGVPVCKVGWQYIPYPVAEGWVTSSNLFVK